MRQSVALYGITMIMYKDSIVMLHMLLLSVFLRPHRKSLHKRLRMHNGSLGSRAHFPDGDNNGTPHIAKKT